jgi:hypothetical protein
MHTVHVVIYFVHRLSERIPIPQIFLLIRGVSWTEFEQKVNNMSITSKCMLQIFRKLSTQTLGAKLKEAISIFTSFS